MRAGLMGLVALGLCVLLMGHAKAVDISQGQLEALNTEALEEQTEGYLDGIELTLDLDLTEGLHTLAQQGLDQLTDILKGTVRTGVLLMAAVLLCSMLEGMQLPLPMAGVDLAQFAGTAAILALALTDVNALSQLGQRTMERMDEFSKVMLPTFSAAAAASGGVTAATVRQVATMFFSDVLLTMIHRLLLPLAYLYTALSAGFAAVGNVGLKHIAALLKWGVTTCLTGLMLLYVTYLSVSSAIAGTADAATAKVASLAISTMVPVVGRILSSATETVVAGAGLVRNAVGIYGLLAVLAFCVGPFLQLGVHYLVYKVTAALSATISGGRIAGLIGDIGGAFGLILGMTGGCGLILLVSIVAGIGVMGG